jgi:sporulation protein YhbH
VGTGPTRSDWSLQRKGPVDQARHEARVREAIREHLEDIVTDPAIITGDGRAIVRVPVRSLKEYRFHFDEQRQSHVGQGDGQTKVGQILARGRTRPGSGGPGPGQGGSEPGTEVIEAEVSVDDLAEIVFAELGLPRLRRRPGARSAERAERASAIRPRGPLSGLDKRRSLVQNLRRHARAGEPVVGSWSDADLRFRHWREDPRPGAAAAVIAMRDVSGSMGEFKKYIARSFFFWMVRFLRARYDDVRIVFIAHHVEAREVDEDTFFRLGESGGTRVSSAYELALKIMRERFPAAAWNVYPFHFSDGDNWGDADNRRCVELVREMLEGAAEVGYGEIAESGYQSPLWVALAEITDPRFVAVALHDRKDIYPALKRFFRPDPGD